MVRGEWNSTVARVLAEGCEELLGGGKTVGGALYIGRSAAGSLVESVYRQTWSYRIVLSGHMWKCRQILESISDPSQTVNGTKN